LDTPSGYSNKIQLEAKVIISSISPSSGSLHGGTEITITGGIFSEDKLQTLAFIGESSINAQCDVIESSLNEVKCITRPMPTHL